MQYIQTQTRENSSIAAANLSSGTRCISMNPPEFKSTAERGQLQAGISRNVQPMLQREDAGYDTQTGIDEAGSLSECRSWMDPKDLSLVAAKHYLRTEFNIEPEFRSVSCSGDIYVGSCLLYFSPGNFLDDIVVSVFLGSTVSVQRRDLTSPWCDYTYECKGKKPPAFTKVSQ